MPGHILYYAGVVSISKTTCTKLMYPSAAKDQIMSEIIIVHPNFGAVLSADVPIRIKYLRMVEYLRVMENAPFEEYSRLSMVKKG